MAGRPGTRLDGWLVGALCLLTATTGVLDATSFLDLGRTFTANMTGNVLLLAFSLTGTSLGGGSDSQGFVIALVGFVVGAVAGAAAAGRRGRAAHLHLGLGLELVAVSFALVVGLTGSVQVTDRRDVVIGLLAIAMELLAAPDLAKTDLADRFAGTLEFGTAGLRGILGAGPNRMNRAVVLTTSLGSLAADLVAVGGRPPRAGRRIATVACIFVGAVAGALLQRHGVGWPLAFALALVVLAGGALARAGWPAPED